MTIRVKCFASDLHFQMLLKSNLQNDQNTNSARLLTACRFPLGLPFIQVWVGNETTCQFISGIPYVLILSLRVMTVVEFVVCSNLKSLDHTFIIYESYETSFHFEAGRSGAHLASVCFKSLF